MTNYFNPNSKADLAIIIISYNTRKMTLECLASVYSQTKTSLEVIVLDNASKDGSAAAIAESFPKVHLIEGDHNYGFGPAHQIAMDQTSAPWVLLLNPDTVILDGAIDRLMAFAQSRPEAGIWGGRTLHADGTLNPTSCFARMTLWSIFCRTLGLNGIFRGSLLFNSEYYGNWPRDCEREVDIVSGCFFLIRRVTWDNLGGFNKAFFMYGEEADLCLRARKQGIRPRVTPTATIIHHGGASQTVRTDKLVRLMRAKIELIKRHLPIGQRRIGLWLFCLWPASRAIAGGVLAKIIRSEEELAKARIWREVWDRRTEWKEGFSES